MDITGLGEKVSNALYHAGYVRSIADLYTLHESAINWLKSIIGATGV